MHRKMKNIHRIPDGKPTGKISSGRPSVDGRIILKHV
jgi:hypothetical protein